MEYKIHGTTLQTLDLILEQGETVFTESGGMAWMIGNIGMETNTRGGVLGSLVAPWVLLPWVGPTLAATAPASAPAKVVISRQPTSRPFQLDPMGPPPKELQ